MRTNTQAVLACQQVEVERRPLRVITSLLEEPVANRPNGTIARMRAEIEASEGVRISRSQLSKALRKKVP